MSEANKCYVKSKTGEKLQGMMRYWEGLEQGVDSNCKQDSQKKPPDRGHLNKDPQLPLWLSGENLVQVEG